MQPQLPRISPDRRIIGDDHLTEIAEIRLGAAPRGAVVVLNDPREPDGHGIDVMNRLAAHGFESFLINEPGSTIGPERAMQLIAYVQSLGWDALQTGIVGYGQQTRLAFELACSVRIGAIVAVGGSDAMKATPGDAIGAVQGPWLGLFGDAGDLHTRIRLARWGRRVAVASPAFVATVVYPVRGDDLWRDSPFSEIHAASFDSYQRTIEWFNRYLEPRPTPLATTWAGSQRTGHARAT